MADFTWQLRDSRQWNIIEREVSEVAQIERIELI
jgi:hypothetical protein